MKFSKTGGQFERVEIVMMPMIDVCFQIIIFFIANMRLFVPEGDFNIQMPTASSKQAPPNQLQSDIPPIRVRLRADKDGNLLGIQMGERRIRSYRDLQRELRDIVGFDRGPGAAPADAEVDFDCDYNLKYEFVVQALTSVSGYLADDKQTVVHMIENIKFAQPRKPE
jgi:biopolymer transport protein ExbD